MSTEIRNRHPQWNNNIYQWVMVKDAMMGESAIKRQSELYLPMPAAMKLEQAKAPSSAKITHNTSFDPKDIHNHLTSTLNPNYHPNEPYMAYKMRAQFPEITSTIHRGLVGMAIKNDPDWELPSSMKYLEENFTKSGSGIIDFFNYIVNQVLESGRVGILVDIDEKDGLPKVVTYAAENIADWTAKTASADETEMSSAILTEMDGEDEIELHLAVRDGMYSIDKHKDDKLLEEGEPITYLGKFLDKVPFVVAGSTDITPDVDIAPMASIARTAIQIYQMDADLRQGEYMSCNPSLVISGIGEEFTPKAIGSTVAIILPDSGAKAYYPSTDTSALNHVSNRIDNLYDKAIQQGVALLGGGKAESGDALRIRRESSTTTLTTAVKSAGKAIKAVLGYIAEFTGNKPDSIDFTPNTEFGISTMDPAQQTALVNTWMAGAMSKPTMLDNFRKAGMLQKGETVEDEMDRIDDEKPDFDDGVDVEPEVDAQ